MATMSKEYNRKYYKTHSRERFLKFRKSTVNIWCILKKNARVRNITFKLDKDDFVLWYDCQVKECRYCGLPESKLSLLPLIGKAKNKRFTIDRKDNNRGYIIDNLALSCNVCNKVKSNILSYEEMLEVGKIIKNRWHK